MLKYDGVLMGGWGVQDSQTESNTLISLSISQESCLTVIGRSLKWALEADTSQLFS